MKIFANIFLPSKKKLLSFLKSFSKLFLYLQRKIVKTNV